MKRWEQGKIFRKLPPKSGGLRALLHLFLWFKAKDYLTGKTMTLQETRRVHLVVIWLSDPEIFPGFLWSTSTKVIKDVVVSFSLTLPTDSRLLQQVMGHMTSNNLGL